MSLAYFLLFIKVNNLLFMHIYDLGLSINLMLRNFDFMIKLTLFD